MFESAELGHKIGKAEYRAAIPALRMALQEAQVAIYEAKIPVILLISGQDGAGKGEIIHSLYEWLDPRFINTLAFFIPSDEERERPAMWRYWRSLPPKGRDRDLCRFVVFQGDQRTGQWRLGPASHGRTGRSDQPV